MKKKFTQAEEHKKARVVPRKATEERRSSL